MNTHKIINADAVPGIKETIPADIAEEMGAFEEAALTEEDALETARDNPTLEELKAVYENPTPLTEDEIKKIFITDDDEKIDLSELKLKK